MASGWDNSGALINSNNGSSPVGVEPDGALLETVQQIGSASGSLQNDVLLLGDTSGHNSDAEHGFARPEMYSKSLLGSVQFYARHVFLCYKNPESWLPQVEAAAFDHLPKLLAAALKARKNETPRKGLTIDGSEPAHLMDFLKASFRGEGAGGDRRRGPVGSVDREEQRAASAGAD